MRWERVQLQPEHQAQHQQGVLGENEIHGPGKRWGHTCNAIREGRLLYVFGGYGKDNCQTNQVHVFDTGGSSPNAQFIFLRFLGLFLCVHFLQFWVAIFVFVIVM
jgi:hypothetical protein